MIMVHATTEIKGVENLIKIKRLFNKHKARFKYSRSVSYQAEPRRSQFILNE